MCNVTDLSAAPVRWSRDSVIANGSTLRLQYELAKLVHSQTYQQIYWHSIYMTRTDWSSRIRQSNSTICVHYGPLEKFLSWALWVGSHEGSHHSPPNKVCCPQLCTGIESGPHASPTPMCQFPSGLSSIKQWLERLVINIHFAVVSIQVRPKMFGFPNHA